MAGTRGPVTKIWGWTKMEVPSFGVSLPNTGICRSRDRFPWCQVRATLGSVQLVESQCQLLPQRAPFFVIGVSPLAASSDHPGWQHLFVAVPAGGFFQEPQENIHDPPIFGT